MAGVTRELTFQRNSLWQLEKMDIVQLNAVNQVDYRILQANIRSMIFHLEDLRE